MILALCASLSLSLTIKDPVLDPATKSMPAALKAELRMRQAEFPGDAPSTLTPAEPLWWFEEVISIGSFKMGLPGILSVLVFMSPIPVILEVLKKRDVGRLPLMPYSAMMINGALWTMYGLLKGAAPIWAPNAIAFINGCLFTAVFVMNCPADADWLPGKALVHLQVAAAIILSAVLIIMVDHHYRSNSYYSNRMVEQVIGIIGQAICVVMFGGPLAAVRTVIEEKSTKALPFAFTLFSFVNCGLWTIYGLYFINDMNIYIPNILGWALATLQLALFVRYGIHQEEATSLKV